jgi:hypothetical protein
METSRADHLAWCKSRAIEYVDQGDLGQAFSSMVSDMNKHPDTANHPFLSLAMQMLMADLLSTPEKMRECITGFN